VNEERPTVSIQSVNPATGEILERFEDTSARQLERILAGADAAFREWRAVALDVRAQKMREAS
jgi:succinate-semialdehyde dehydrogenase / glutarate-semialdehyde dehydrogenase